MPAEPEPRTVTPLGVVIDTNVLLDILVFGDPRSIALWHTLAASTPSVRCWRSTATDTELDEVLSRPQFAARLAAAGTSVNACAAGWFGLAAPVDRIFAAPWHCTDPRDQKFLDLASTARAGLLVSKDKAVLKVDRRSRRDGLRIVLPEQAQALLAAASTAQAV